MVKFNKGRNFTWNDGWEKEGVEKQEDINKGDGDKYSRDAESIEFWLFP